MVMPTAATGKTPAAIKTQSNGLPEGVKIIGHDIAAIDSLSPTSSPAQSSTPSSKPAAKPSKTETVAAKPDEVPVAAEPDKPAIKGLSGLIKQRKRIIEPATLDANDAPNEAPIAATAEPETATKPTSAATTSPLVITHSERIVEAPAGKTKPRKRKVGRPKAGRLDVPRTAAVIASTAPAAAAAVNPVIDQASSAVIASAVKASASPVAAAEATPSADKPANSASHHHEAKRHMSDIRPRTKPAKVTPPAHHVHHVGVAPLHFGSVLGFALTARAKHHHLALASCGAIVLGAVGGIGSWLALTGQLQHVADGLLHVHINAIAEVILLALLYYVGRSIGQAAITYGVIRQADSRPVGLSMQFGVAINTFGRRLALDLLFGLSLLGLLAATGALVISGGVNWGIPTQAQIVILFFTYLILLYLMAALAISHGLANVAVVLTKQPAGQALKLGWNLFRHRLELIGIRAVAVLMEVALVVPSLAAAIAVYAYTPASYHLGAGVLIGLITWLAGALAGAGTATWWAAIYRKIVLLDHPQGAVELLSSRQPAAASQVKLAVIVAVSTALLLASLFVPFI